MGLFWFSDGLQVMKFYHFVTREILRFAVIKATILLKPIIQISKLKITQYMDNGANVVWSTISLFRF